MAYTICLRYRFIEKSSIWCQVTLLNLKKFEYERNLKYLKLWIANSRKNNKMITEKGPYVILNTFRFFICSITIQMLNMKDNPNKKDLWTWMTVYISIMVFVVVEIFIALVSVTSCCCGCCGCCGCCCASTQGKIFSMDNQT